jgi:hypothetical protein
MEWRNRIEEGHGAVGSPRVSGAGSCHLRLASGGFRHGETVRRLGKGRIMIAASDALRKPGGVVDAIRRAWCDLCRRLRPLHRACAPRFRARVRAGGSRASARPHREGRRRHPMDTVKVVLFCLGKGIADEAGFDAVRIRVDPDGARIVPPVKDPPPPDHRTDDSFGGRVLRPWRCDEPRTRTGISTQGASPASRW